MNPTKVLADRDLFEKIWLFADVRFASVAHYLAECRIDSLDAGRTLLSPEAANRTLFVVLCGELEVRLDGAGGRVISTLRRGDCAGELSVIDLDAPSAWVVAVADCQLLVIEHDTLWALVNASHGFARNLLGVVSGRIREDNSVIVDSEIISRHYHKKSVTDAITGLHNRRWMGDYFRREIARCQIDKSPACLVLVDIDQFRGFNNRFGHLVGDHALGFVAENLRSQFRTDDLVARYGGDEFAIFLPNIDLEAAKVIAERVRGSIDDDRAAALRAVKTKLGVTVSLGLADLKMDDSFESLMRRADEALYRSKKGGGNRLSV